MSETTPMTLVHARALVDRTYSETGRFQWAREAAMNSIEAGATKIQFGLDWNGVRATGTYRRFIADNGCGMAEDELVTFFRTLGGSSKVVGGAHENYGIGAKIALLPWNTAGLLVASWQGGVGNVIWAKADDETGEYGLRKVTLGSPPDDEIVDVWPTGEDPDLDFDLEALKPSWLEDHGTVLLLLGRSLDQHTMRNDPLHDLAGTTALRDHLGRRFWEIPQTVEIQVDELPHDNPERWPGEVGGKPLTKRALSSSQRTVKQRANESGVVALDDGTKLHWFLRFSSEEERETWSKDRGFVAALYKGELYEHKYAHYDYRTFGVAHKDVRRGLWLIAEPPLADAARQNGVFPEGDRNSLLWNRDGGVNSPLPWNEWGHAFADQMPEEIRSALDQHRRDGELEDEEYRQKLADLFGERFKMSRLVVDDKGEASTTPTAPRKRRKKRPGSAPGPQPDEDEREGEVGRTEGERPAKQVTPSLSLPRWESCDPEDVGTGMIACFVPHHPDGPTVMLNTQHSVIQDQVAYWTEHYPHDPEMVREIVDAVYGQCAVAAIAHSERLKELKVDRRTITENVRSDEALTLALLGLLPHDQLISQRLAAKLGKRRANGEAAA